MTGSLLGPGWLTKYYDSRVLVTEAVHERVDMEQYVNRALGKVQVKGASQPFAIYD
eukprot:gene2114-5919_t